jgi:hypothetical protein
VFQEVSPISCFRNELGAWVITRDEGGRAGVVQKKGVILKRKPHTHRTLTVTPLAHLGLGATSPGTTRSSNVRLFVLQYYLMVAQVAHHTLTSCPGTVVVSNYQLTN